MYRLVPELNVARLAREGGAWRGSIAVDQFERLGALLYNDVETATRGQTDGSARVSAALDFALDADGRPRVTGRCQVAAVVRCGRCAEAVGVEVDSRLDFRIVASEAEAQTLMPDLDVVVSTGPGVLVTALMEDDILLSIPETGCVDGEPCPLALPSGIGEMNEDGDERSPFEVLRTLVPGRAPA